MKFKALIIVVVLFAANVVISNAETSISHWDFNSTSPDADTSTGSLSPSSGTGSLAAIGGVSTKFVLGSPGDPADSGEDNSGLNLSSWASQGTGNATCGLQVSASTEGFDSITISLDFRQSSTASRYFQLQVSADGTTFQNVSGGTTTLGTIGSGNTETTFTTDGLYSNMSAGSSFVEAISYTLPFGSVYANNPNFAFRWVEAFDPADGANYTPSDSGSNYGTSGTGRFDQLSLIGSSITVVPEPSALALVALGLAGLALSRRKSV